MRAVDIIQKKRDKEELTKEEIGFLLDGYMKGEVPDYQMSSFLMATYFNGMTDDELDVFTERMMNSGEVIKFEGIEKFLVDKHSTGGVGDKTTIALAPIFASFDIGTAKLSGRGLGHTGGTIDKFESVEGFEFPQTRDKLVEVANETGIGIMGYSDTIVPLDKKLYGLRDVTATVQSIPLIASSIMSKKLAVYADGIILDVKVGSGAFMKSLDEAGALANEMIRIGKSFSRNVIAVLTNMDQPLGKAVGNSLEVIEAIETLKGNGPEDFTVLVHTLAAIGLKLKGDVETVEEGIEKVKEMIESGKPLEMMKNFLNKYNGNGNIVDDYNLLPVAENVYELKSDIDGYISGIEAEMVGKSAMVLGAGRATKEDDVDHSVGLILEKKVGDKVAKGDVLAKIYYKSEKTLKSSIEFMKNSLTYSTEKVEKQDVIIDIRQ